MNKISSLRRCCINVPNVFYCMFVKNTHYPKIEKTQQILLKECIWHILGLSWETKINIRPLPPIVFANNAPNICDIELKVQGKIWGLLYQCYGGSSIITWVTAIFVSYIWRVLKNDKRLSIIPCFWYQNRSKQ